MEKYEVAAGMWLKHEQDVDVMKSSLASQLVTTKPANPELLHVIEVK